MILPQFLHKYLVYPAWTIKDQNYPFRYLREFERNQYADPEKLEALRWQRTVEMLRHAYEHTEFYNKRWRLLDIHPNDILSWQDFSRIPLLEKQDIQQCLGEMVSSSYARTELVRNQTGGSTGQPLHFYHDRARMASRLASTIRHDRWAGKDYSTKFACFWGHPAESKSGIGSRWAAWKDRNIGRVCFLDTSSLSIKRFEEFTKILNREQPPVFLAYANSIYLYARFLHESGVRHFHCPQSIITSAEVLTPEMRDMIEGVFGCKIYNRYGCRETSVIASECDQHNAMHVNVDCLHVETIRNGTTARAGEVGEVVITDLLNKGMPLIRYRIRDAAIALTEECACGRTLPLIDIVGGRVTDFISTPDGRIVSGASLTIYLIAHAVGVAQAQLFQEERGGLVIRVHRGPGYSDATTKFLLKTAAQFLGAAIRVTIEFLEEPIPVSASGKYHFAISKVDPFA